MLNFPNLISTAQDIQKRSINQDILILLSSEEEALRYFKYVKFIFTDFDIVFLPSEDCMPYDRLSSSQKIITSRAEALVRLAIKTKPVILVTSAINLLHKYIPKELARNGYIKIQKDQVISANTLETLLLSSNYSKTPVAIDPGDYSKRGEIIDIVNAKEVGFRINFEWDRIISIKLLDTESQISNGFIEEIEIFPASHIKLQAQEIENFRNKYLISFGISKMNETLFEKISNGVRPEAIENFSPIFFASHENLSTYLDNPVIYSSHFAASSIAEKYKEIEDFYYARINSVDFFPAFKPDALYFEASTIEPLIQKSLISVNESNIALVPDFFSQSLVESAVDPMELFFSYYKNNLDKKIIICCYSNYSLQKISDLASQKSIAIANITKLQDAEYKLINICRLHIDISFRMDNLVIISDKYILGQKIESKIKSSKKLKNILKEYENFAENDLVVHAEHGIGRYEGIENIQTLKVRHDCLKIVYSKGDRLFIPVENAHNVKKYGDGEAQLDTLGGAAWQRRKAKLKDRIGEIAISLLDIAAKRGLVKLDPLEYDMGAYEKFVNQFPYVETEDQAKAIDDIIEDLKAEKPMDRLICGDVGFGKTEVAMRASFLISQHKQVAIVVPTTILARQHYLNFLERFKGFDVKIGHISRFVSPKEVAATKKHIENGEIDIIIGTHGLLADSMKFYDLGLVIIDEEQHFGVLQKEKLKKIRSSVHSLTLSATPIPRTLQSSLVGIKDLSLIASPPIDRLSVKTHLIDFHDVVIRDALLRERFRGGKSFVVAPRVSDLTELSQTLKYIVPELSFKIAHGGLAASAIDKIMHEFYEGDFDILLSTAIVESGLDVPSANTMIIFRAEMFGLSQLYQLRGRVGRRKVRGYTYLVLDRKKLPTKNARRRLEIMQSLDSLGAGFSVASHDMDIRGFGNMIGDEQSGHIKEVGIELYQEMLQDAIEKVKDPSYIETQEVCEIKINIPVYIPDEYIQDSSARLAIYRRAGEIQEASEIEELSIELIDRFGLIPAPTKNLIDLISLRLKCSFLYIKSLDVGPGGITARFLDNINSDFILEFVAKYPRNTKIKPGNKLVFFHKIQEGAELIEVNNFLGLIEKIRP
ncbi:MAG: transcription-repair coupling factor [Alphaproteobacteria bacterium]|nr:transcription-repair coupling factor [Alphaproteobacteria bacterium]